MSTFHSEARVATSRSARYLGQLCKHFAHRIPATFSDAQGRIEFPSGTCELEASGDVLILRATAADAPSLSQVEDVVGAAPGALCVPRQAGDQLDPRYAVIGITNPRSGRSAGRCRPPRPRPRSCAGD